jgi:hypothetical protein
MVQERSQQRPIAGSEHGPADLALQDGELVPQRKDLDVLVAVAHRQQAYEGEGVRHRKVGQSQHRTIMTPTGHAIRRTGRLRTVPTPARRLKRLTGR